MTKRERVSAALRHKETDYIPYDVGFTQPAWAKMAEFYNDNDFVDKIGNHVTGIYYSGGENPVPGKPGYYQDDFGVVWNRTVDKDIGVIEGLCIPTPDISALAKYRFPQVPEAMLRQQCEESIAMAGDRFRCANLGFSLFERAWTLCGMENLLIYMVTEPDFVTELFRAITDFNLQVIDIFLDYDFDAVYFGDDWGQQRGLIMGPDLWRKFVKPSLTKMYGLVKDKNRFVAQHSCGDISEIFPDVIEAGLDAYQTFQPEIYDIRTTKAQYGHHLSFWGGISTQRLLPFESPNSLIKKAAEIMQIVGKNGGLIAGPTHAIPGDVPPENIDAMIKLFQNQDQYL